MAKAPSIPFARFLAWLGIDVVFVAATAGWRSGRRPVIAVVAAMLCVAASCASEIAALRHGVASAGAVSAALPLRTELFRLPASTFLPSPDLPLAGAVLQVFFVVALAELALRRMIVIPVAVIAQLSSTLLARIALTSGFAAVFGVGPGELFSIDTGPSAVTTAVGAILLFRCRARAAGFLLGAALLAAALLQRNLDGYEHLIAYFVGVAVVSVLTALSPYWRLPSRQVRAARLAERHAVPGTQGIEMI